VYVDEIIDEAGLSYHCPRWQPRPQVGSRRLRAAARDPASRAPSVTPHTSGDGTSVDSGLDRPAPAVVLRPAQEE